MNVETNQKKCNFCKKDVDIKATKCHHCQADLRSWFRRHYIISAIFLMFAIPFIISNFISTFSNSLDKAEQAKVQNALKDEPIIFDISTFQNAKIEEVIAKLGEPTSKFTPTKKQQEQDYDGDITYKKHGEELTVTYNMNTKKVIDFFIPSKEAENKITIEGKAKILKKLNLSEDSKQFGIQFNKNLKNPSLFTGVIIKIIDPLADSKEYNARFYSSYLIKNGVTLKSPSTADYKTPTYAKRISENTYEVTSYVDSENGFGAITRSDWTVTLQYVGKEEEEKIDYTVYPKNWKLIKATFAGEDVM